LADWRGWSKIVVRTSVREQFDKLPGTTQNEKLHNLLIAKGAAQVPPSLSVAESTVSSPAGKLLSPDGSGENFSEHLARCQMMDSLKIRCLRNAPIKTYQIDKGICEACQFKGLHYPPDLNGLTPREVTKIERQLDITQRRKEIAELELDKERERTERAPVRVLY